MGKSHFFTSSHLSRVPFCVVASTWGIAACLILASLFLLSIPVQAVHLRSVVTTHGCAPNTPPPVSGTPIPVPSTVGSVWINELLSDPHTSWNCQDPLVGSGPEFNSWIELYNPQSQPLNFYLSHAQISLDGGSNWYTFPFGSAIAPGGFLVIFPLVNNSAQPPSMWNVVLAIAGSTGEIIIDQVTIPILLADQSYGRIPDGSSNWQIVGQPTIDASNNASDQPVTAVPTKTPKSTQTPKPTTTTAKSGGSSSPSSSGTTLPTNFGTQPAGDQLQIPASTTPVLGSSGTAATPVLHQDTLAVSSTPTDAWHIAGLISLLLLFGGALVLCWWLFRSP